MFNASINTDRLVVLVLVVVVDDVLDVEDEVPGPDWVEDVINNDNNKH